MQGAQIENLYSCWTNDCCIELIFIKVYSYLNLKKVTREYYLVTVYKIERSRILFKMDIFTRVQNGLAVTLILWNRNK